MRTRRRGRDALLLPHARQGPILQRAYLLAKQVRHRKGRRNLGPYQ